MVESNSSETQNQNSNENNNNNSNSNTVKSVNISSEQNVSTTQNLIDRKNLIETAVRFLKNPKVAPTPIENKRQFLIKKGLTEAEVELVIKQAYPTLEQSNTTTTIDQTNQLNDSNKLILNNTQQQQEQPNTNLQVKPRSVWLIVFKWIKNFLIAGCLAFTAYKLFIKKYLYQKTKEAQNKFDLIIRSNEKLNESIKEMRSSVNSLKDALESISNCVKQNQLQKSPSSLEEQSIRGEIQSLKNLLLNRNQFPSIPIASPVLPPWQLESKNFQKEKPAGLTSQTSVDKEQSQQTETTIKTDASTSNSNDKLANDEENNNN